MYRASFLSRPKNQRQPTHTLAISLKTSSLVSWAHAQRSAHSLKKKNTFLVFYTASFRHTCSHVLSVHDNVPLLPTRPFSHTRVSPRPQAAMQPKRNEEKNVKNAHLAVVAHNKNAPQTFLKGTNSTPTEQWSPTSQAETSKYVLATWGLVVGLVELLTPPSSSWSTSMYVCTSMHSSTPNAPAHVRVFVRATRSQRQFHATACFHQSAGRPGSRTRVAVPLSRRVGGSTYGK